MCWRVEVKNLQKKNFNKISLKSIFFLQKTFQVFGQFEIALNLRQDEFIKREKLNSATLLKTLCFDSQKKENSTKYYFPQQSVSVKPNS